MWIADAFNLLFHGHITQELETIEYLSSRFEYLESEVSIDALMRKHHQGTLLGDGHYLNLLEEQYRVLVQLNDLKSKYRGFMNFKEFKKLF